MKTTLVLTEQPGLLWRFLGFFQTPFLRLLHAVIVVLILIQFFDSMGISISTTGQFGLGELTLALSWTHIVLGLTTLILACILTGESLTNKGFKHFFPYLWGDVAQIRADLEASLRLEVVGPRPKGLAAAVQGLGLGALLLTVLSGGAWLLFMLSDVPDWAATARSTHKAVTSLLLAYLLGHGGMALLHFTMWQRKVIWKKKA